MNRFGSHPIQENRAIYEGPPGQGFSEARLAGVFLYLVTNPPQGRPSGVAAFIVPDG